MMGLRRLARGNEGEEVSVWGWIAVAALAALLLCAGAAFLLAQIASRRGLGPADAAAPWDAAHGNEARREIEWFLANGPEQAEIVSRDGLRLRGRYLPSGRGRQAILLVHGYRAKNGEGDFAPLLRFYHELGLDILVIDQRAHGQSEGDRICFGVKERHDCVDWLHWLNQRAQPDDLFMAGLSMGAATVLMAAELDLPANLRCLIADCGYTSPWDICAHVLKGMRSLPVQPFLPMANWMLRGLAGFDLRECAALSAMSRNSRLPVLFIHGGKDRFVPPSMSRANYAACLAQKKLVIVPEAGHAMSAWEAPERVKAEAAAFIARFSTAPGVGNANASGEAALGEE